ncbi:MAG: HAMP domain-containing protein [Gemmatimonadaceae bacterium]|nr:HAMP domain-containing protein [Gemmatimonadaceae bacterium]
MSLSRRLLAGSLLVIGVLVTLVVLSLDWRLSVRLRDDTTAELLREAQLVATSWQADIDPDALANRAGAALGHRVTLIGADGVVLGDSEFDQPALGTLENHRTRPEVVAAMDSGVGASIRPSPSAGDEELYAARRGDLGVVRVSISTAAQRVIVRRVQADVLSAAFLATAAALLLAVFFARSVTRPILELRDDARAIAAGDLSRRPSLVAPGEVGELASAFHRLAEQLSARVAALEADDALLRALTEALNEGIIALDGRQQVLHMNAGARRLLGVRDELPFPADRLPRDRSLRDALTAALAGVSTEALELQLNDRSVTLTALPLDGGGAVLALLDVTPVRRLETVRRDFVANVSHELRTPLTIVSGFAETLQDASLPVEDRGRFVATILANTQRMQRIVDDLLDLSRIESGGWRPNPTHVDLKAAVQEVFDSVRPVAEQKGLALVPAIPADVPSVYADPTALRQVLSNLVDNALRHTTAGRISISARRENGGVALAVRDTGAGIGAEHLPRIFERFYRVDAARSRHEGGTGLGLAIVKHMVEAHGGRVRAESAANVGTTVALYLPDSGDIREGIEPTVVHSAEPSTGAPRTDSSAAT